MKLRAIVAVLATTTLLPVLALAAPAHAEEDAVLTWPDLTSFDYGEVDYVIHVETEDVTGLQVTVNGADPQPVSAAGDLRPHFTKGGRQVVAVRRCNPTCAQVDYRILEAYDTFVVPTLRALPDFGPDRGIKFDYPLMPAGIATTQTWSIVDPGATPAEDVVLASGQDEFDSTGGGHFGPAKVPLGTPEGTYELRVSLAGESETFGTLDRDLPARPVTYDATPDPGTLTLSEAVIYPEKDDYLDRLTFGVTGPNPEVVITDPSGAERERLDLTGKGTGSWSPGKIAPGTYDLTLTTSDEAHNTATVVKHVQVRSGHLAWKKDSVTLKAASTLVSKQVGSCSSLATPAAGGPKGSLGYYSQTKCTRDDDSVVVTVNAADLPTSFTGKYRDFRITVNGGAAKGAKRAYAVLYYYDAKTKSYVNRAQLSSPSGAHAGKGVRKPTSIVVDAARKPHVFWSLGLTAGSRYDVQSFTVAVTYEKLVG